MRTACLLSLRVAFFEVASWLRKFSHTGVEINHACHPHAASLCCPVVGYLLWCVMAAVWSCLSSVSGLFQWLFPLHSTQNALNIKTLQNILQSQTLRDLSCEPIKINTEVVTMRNRWKTVETVWLTSLHCEMKRFRKMSIKIYIAAFETNTNPFSGYITQLVVMFKPNTCVCGTTEHAVNLSMCSATPNTVS